MLGEIGFAYKHFLLLLAAIPLLAAWYIWKQRERHASLRYPHTGFLDSSGKGLNTKFIHVTFILR
ncbi:MAG: BatA domain-containing protein [Bacteroidales bacterium]